MVSFLHVASQDGRDAEIITTYALSGAALWVLALVALNRHLYPEIGPPALQLQTGPTGGVSLAVVLRF